MPTIKHVGNHPDQLHDGRPFPPGETRTITEDDLALDHYQGRLADRTFLLVDPPAPTEEPVDGYDHMPVDEVTALLDVATPAHYEAIKTYEAAHKDRKTIRDHVAPTTTDEGASS